ncbi:SDR family oxidoreductase [Thiomicrospira cyclica]|uniref:dTDP-4-dehydrorhamnose reductase n=1 Tax=Thiomicrospira cyclica (strain DSM 14477 / JCM 11371 / ALM1) TaxID=717773 RepID=F6DD08_THICA|nr:dTDP-4-dehydrorhamnose reductase [Thiomicrospira cyclica]AEG31744.1 dTDP-4-dehydrorhamnose reductase [Thiomicrospira cyclica ALM1]
MTNSFYNRSNADKPILVIGQHGQLGQSLQKLVRDGSDLLTMSAGADFRFVGRDALDLSSNASILGYFADKDFGAIINCAAYTAVDKAESNAQLAEQINHLAVAQLGAIAQQQSIPLIHISTDYVFNGQACRPYLEANLTAPINVYGATKQRGEQAVIVSGCRGAIIRTSWLYSEFGHNFVKTLLRLGREQDSVNVVADQIGSPTYASDLARVILSLLQHPDNLTAHPDSFPGHSGSSPAHSDSSPRHSGEGRNLPNPKMLKHIPHDKGVSIYHYSNKGACSWYDFAKAILELSNSDCKINPIESKDYPTPATRPSYSLLDTTKIKQALPDLVIRHWRDALQTCLNELEPKP